MNSPRPIRRAGKRLRRIESTHRRWPFPSRAGRGNVGVHRGVHRQAGSLRLAEGCREGLRQMTGAHPIRPADRLRKSARSGEGHPRRHKGHECNARAAGGSEAEGREQPR